MILTELSFYMFEYENIIFQYLITASFLLFFIGFSGLFSYQADLILFFLSFELMLLSISLIFIFWSIYLDDFLGQVFTLFILTIAAAEVAIGLALTVLFFKLRGFLRIDFINILKG